MILLTVPGNLLLMGEYAVLEKGGLGITLGVDQRITLTLEPGNHLEIRGTYGKKRLMWNEQEAQSNGKSLFDWIIKVCREDLALPLFKGKISIDSSRFYRNGLKRGYGSSAAVTVGLMKALTGRAEISEEAFFSGAVKAHRNFQNGKGSGYDIAASLFGGTGLFRGGNKPAFSRVKFPAFKELYLFNNSKPVLTKESVKKYNRWKKEYPLKQKKFLKESNDNVRAFIEAKCTEAAMNAFLRARDLGIKLGEMIGSPADFPEMEAILKKISPHYKALGAGNELGLLINEKNKPPKNGFEKLNIAREGVQWS